MAISVKVVLHLICPGLILLFTVDVNYYAANVKLLVVVILIHEREQVSACIVFVPLY